jgi:hypothetical protein
VTAHMSTSLSQIGTPALIALGVVGLLELAAIAWGVYDIWGGRGAKSQPWLWTVVVIVLNWIGVIVYIAAGRRPAMGRSGEQRPKGPGRPEGADPAELDPERSRRADDALDVLYGRKKE